MSVGHVARAIEEAGVSTVSVFIEAFAHYAEQMWLPRTLSVPHPMGRPLGPPGRPERQREVIEAALDLVDEADAGGHVVELGGGYRPPTGPA